MLHIKRENGWIEVIFGCMFAGKSSEILKRIDILRISKQRYQAFAPSIDDRYGEKKIANHMGWSHPAINVNSAQELLDHLKPETDFIIVDEIQFFSKNIVKVLVDLANKGKKIIVSGLAADFRGIPFETTILLLVRAEYVTYLNSICNKCYDSAHKIQRLTNGKPSSANEKTITVGDWENIHYEARCRSCYKIKDFNWKKDYTKKE